MVGTLLGRYRLLEKIGAGGMGVVYRARDERLERDVAVKILPAGTLADEAQRRRFRKEALVLSKLNHANIAMVLDFDTQEGVDFLVMEYVPGETLDDKLARGALPESEVQRLGMQLAQGLVEAHEKWVVHRDLKPGNLQVTPDGQLKILDFGVASLRQPVSETSTTRGLSRATASAASDTGDFAGTVPYMSPEQLSGGKVDARSDVYAAGTVLYEMATGKRPFWEVQGPQLVAAILNQTPPVPTTLNREISPELESVVLKALEKEPDHRYQSARELRMDLERLGTSAPLLAQRPRPRRRRRWLALAGAAAVLVVAGLMLNAYGLRDRFLGRSSRIRSLAVLPIENLSGDPNQEYFADGMTDQLITDLAQITALKVISRTSSMQYKSVRKPLREIARELGVEAIVAGSVLRSGERMRITAQLIRASTDEHIWAQSYDRDVSDFLALQNEVARAITDTIRVTVAPGELASPSQTRKVDPLALEAYLKGRYQYDHSQLESAIASFEQAITIDPGYAQAYAGLARTYCQGSGGVFDSEEALPKAKAAAKRALELDPGLADVYTDFGYFKAFYEWKWQEAEADFKRAIQLHPGGATGHSQYAYYLTLTKRFDEAIVEYRRARELDPLSVAIEIGSLIPLNWGRRYDQAIQAASKVLESRPDDRAAKLIRGQAYLFEKRYAESIAQLRQLVDSGDTGFWDLSSLGSAYARSGNRSEALKILQRMQASPKDMELHAYCVAVLYTALGDKDRAFEWLDKSIESHSEEATAIPVDPLLDALREDPRYKALLPRLGFPAG